MLGILFVLIGVAAVWLDVRSYEKRTTIASGNANDASPSRGRLRVRRAVFLMTWFMILKIKGRTDELSLPSMLHILIATVLAPLFFVRRGGAGHRSRPASPRFCSVDRCPLILREFPPKNYANYETRAVRSSQRKNLSPCGGGRPRAFRARHGSTDPMDGGIAGSQTPPSRKLPGTLQRVAG
jgi:hypothetical protein